MYTFADYKTACAPFVKDGRCSDDAEVAATINRAMEILMDEGDWKHTVQKMRIRTYNNSIALPHGVETVLKVDNCGVPVMVHNIWYEFLDGGPGMLLPESVNTVANDLKDEGYFPTFFPIGNSQRYLIALSTEAGDVGETIRIRGVDEDFMEVAPTVPGELLKIGRWINGVEGAMPSPANLNIVKSDNRFLGIDSIINPVTQGYVTLYAYDPDTPAFWLLGKYGPWETQPSYRRYRITSAVSASQECLMLLVKRRHETLVYDSDVPAIQSKEATIRMCQAINEWDNGNDEKGQIKLALALRVLNKQLGNANRGHQIDFDVGEAFGSMPEYR